MPVPDPQLGTLDLMVSSLRQYCWGLRPCGLAAALLLMACAGVRAQPGDAAAVVIVFDGSGSMWGPIEGTRQSKLVVAREGVRRALAKLAPQTRVGPDELRSPSR